MSLSFLPQIIADDVTYLTEEFLQSRGITTLFMDFDNTIVPYSTNVPVPAMDDWLHTLAKSEIITVCVVSNSHKDRVKIFCDGYGIPCITHARKPTSKGLRVAQETYGVSHQSTALVGDQIFTDILGGNIFGVTSILVKPISLSNWFLTLRHWVEQPFISAARGRKI
ncbi:MAG: YqeG family HAD IIIA-type phosphatase [Eubacteriales bacterium]